MLAAARAWAFLDGRDYVIPEDVQAVLPTVVGHRLRERADATGHGVVRWCNGCCARCRRCEAAVRAVLRASGVRLLPRFRDRWLLRRIPPASSVRLNQRRIFIMPTAVGLTFMAALLLMLLTAINYQNSLAYGLTFLLGSLYLVTILHTWRNLAGLVLQAGGTTAAFVGEQALLRVRLESQGRAYQAVALGWPASGLRLVDIPAGGTVEVELSLPTRRRGWLRPGRVRVESRFPLGLLVAWSWIDLELAALVYPQPSAAERPQGGSAPETEDEGVLTRGSGVDDYQGLAGLAAGRSASTPALEGLFARPGPVGQGFRQPAR